MGKQSYTWRVGDVFSNGKYRWAVDSVSGDRAVLRSCSSKWATTMLLTFDEWNDAGQWKLEVEEPDQPPHALGEFA